MSIDTFISIIDMLIDLQNLHSENLGITYLNIFEEEFDGHQMILFILK